MNKIINRANMVLSAIGVNATAATVLAFLAFIVAILGVAYRNPPIAVFLFFAVSLVSHIIQVTKPPAPADIADAAGMFLETASSSLKDSLSVFQSLYYDTIPIEGTDQQQYFPRWEWKSIKRNGVTVIQVGLLRLSKTALSADTLKQERRVLQDLLSDNLRRGLVPLVAHPTYSDGTPTICLLDIKEDGAYLCFEYVWVGDAHTADFVHRYDLPDNSGNIDDQDF